MRREDGQLITMKITVAIIIMIKRLIKLLGRSRKISKRWRRAIVLIWELLVVARSKGASKTKRVH